MSPSYSYPWRAFPFPEDLPCGDPYINWPADEDLVLRGGIDTEVAIPETWIEVGVGKDGNLNRTREAYSLVMARMRTMTCDTTKFVPMYRNKSFETSDDQFIQPDAYYLEYIGTPALHTRSKNNCDMTYHLLSYRWEGSPMQRYNLAKYEGNDWLFQLYTGDTDKPFQMPTRDPLVQSDIIKVCDGRGSHTKYNSGKKHMWSCDFPDNEGPWPAPCSQPVGSMPVEPVEPAEPNENSLGLVIGVLFGAAGAMLLVGLGLYFAPRLRKILRGEGRIRI